MLHLLDIKHSQRNIQISRTSVKVKVQSAVASRDRSDVFLIVLSGLGGSRARLSRGSSRGDLSRNLSAELGKSLSVFGSGVDKGLLDSNLVDGEASGLAGGRGSCSKGRQGQGRDDSLGVNHFEEIVRKIDIRVNDCDDDDDEKKSQLTE